MSIIRTFHNRENPYVLLNKQPLFDSSISFRAKGLWAQCLARKDDWKFYISEIVKNNPEGKSAIYSAINELINARYAVRIQTKQVGKTKKGHLMNLFSGVEYVFFEFKMTEGEISDFIDKFKKSFPLSDFRYTEKLNPENAPLVSKESLESKDNNPPPSPPPVATPSSRSPRSPLQKEDWRKRISSEWTDKEFEYAWSKLETRKGKVTQIQAYLETTMQNYRDANGFSVSQDDRISRHRKEVQPFDNHKINGDKVTVLKDRVEFTFGSHYYSVNYDIDDIEWENQIKRWINQKTRSTT